MNGGNVKPVKKTSSQVLTGGNENIIVKKVPSRTPFITDAAKEAKKVELAQSSLGKEPLPDKYEQNMRPHGVPTFKLEMFEPVPSAKTPTVPYPPAPPVLPPLGDGRFDAQAYQNLLYPRSVTNDPAPYQIPIQNVYNISTPGPTGSHVQMDRIYRGLLPGRDGKMSSTSVGERLQVYDFLRQFLVKRGDGEKIGLESDSDNNLFSYLKLLELNENFYSPITENPYRGLSYGFLIYRSGYPITLTNSGSNVVCDVNAIMLNIRLYSLSYGEYYPFAMNNPILTEYDVWREMITYEYVRENIIRNRQSPNFPILYAYFIAISHKIDFYALKKNSLSQKDRLTQEWQDYVKMYGLIAGKKGKKSTSLAKPPVAEVRTVGVKPPEVLAENTYSVGHPAGERSSVLQLPDEMDPALQKYSGNTLVMITEAPHQNIYQWASKLFKTEGIVKRMTSTGYHPSNVWLSVFFQIIHALYVMQVNGIYISEMTLQDNVYIKELETPGRPNGHWRFVVNGVNYYLPNYGVLVMIDSNYKDIVPKSSAFQTRREYKIHMKHMIQRNESDQEIREKCYLNYRRLVNPNCFTPEYTLTGVNRPPEEIMNLLSRMVSNPEKDLSVILETYFSSLMNNRIGTLLLKDTEIPYIRERSRPFYRGELAVEEYGTGQYRWVQINAVLPDGKVKIWTSEDNRISFLLKEILPDSLKQFSPTEKVVQDSTLQGNFTEAELIETYVISE